MAEALGEALLYLRTDDRGLDAGIAKAKPKAEALGATFDNTSSSATKMGAAMDVAGASATRFGTAQAGVTKTSGAQRAGMQQLSMQISDVATMYSLGARPMQIFASQIGQITQAVQLASGGSSKFAAIMGSPWTMAISTAAIVLVPLISNLFDTEDATDKAGKANETFADKLDRTKHSLGDVIQAVRDYNAEQKKANETTLESAQAAALAAAQNIKEAISIRQKIQATLESYQASARAGPTGPGGQGQIGAQAGASYIEAQQAKNDKLIADLEQAARDAAANVARELAALDTDEAKRIKHNAELERKKIDAALMGYEEKRKAIAEINREEKKALDTANAAARSSRTNSKPSSSASASLGDMTALIKTLFGAGSQITSTTGGKHVKGSDHYAARALDFIPEGGMGQYSTAEVEQILKDAGVSIRRNARGTQQLFGPGRSASKPGDHDDHFHLAWSGKASPEEAQQRQARAAEEEARRTERYSRDLAGLQNAALDVQGRLADTAEERYQLESQGLEISIAEQKRRIVENADYSEAQKAALLAELEKKASLERELLDRRKQEELARQALEIAQATQANEAELLQKQLRLTDTREERRAIEQQLLDIAYDQRRRALEAVKKDDPGYGAAQVELGGLDAQKAMDQRQLDRDYESPLERYRREVQGVGNNINDEMEKIAVDGLDRLSDGLADVITGAKSLGEVFKGIADQIIAELARIAIQQLVIMPLLNALGGGGGGGGFGGGGGGFGSMFAGLFAKGGLIPTGSFGIVGEAGPEPVFATSGGIGVLPNSSFRSGAMGGGGTQVSIPIQIDATGADAAGLARVQSQLDRLQAELPGTIVRTVQDAGDRRIIQAGGWR